MKAGTENKKRLWIAVVLGVIAVLALIRAFTSSDTPSASPAEQTAQANPGGHVGGRINAESLDPRLRLDLLENTEKIKYEGKGRNIFRASAEDVEIPKIEHRVTAKKPEPPPVYTPPPPPPINLRYFGIANRTGEQPSAFLSQGEDVWIAHEGDVVNRQYKIVRITPNSIEIEDLLNNNRQSIPRTQG